MNLRYIYIILGNFKLHASSLESHEFRMRGQIFVATCEPLCDWKVGIGLDLQLFQNHVNLPTLK